MFSLSQILPRASLSFGTRVAALESGNRATFADLFQRVTHLAGGLAALGLRAGDRIAILDHNSLRYLETYYACAHLGLVLMPLNWRLAAPEIKYILEDAQAKTLVVAKPFFSLLEDIRGALGAIEHIIAYGDDTLPSRVNSYEAMISSATPMLQPILSAPDDVAQIYYTSGTTGRPKGVCLTHHNMAVGAMDVLLAFNLGYNDCWLHASPMFHLVDAWAPWALPLVGGRQSIVHFNAVDALATIEQHRATATSLAPTAVSMIADCAELEKFDISWLRFIMYGGSPTAAPLLRKWLGRLPCKLMHAYGTTETSGPNTVLHPDTLADMDIEAGLQQMEATGRPVSTVQLRIVDNSDVNLENGRIGEVLIGGPRVMKGYWNQPEATKDALYQGWYRSGDMGFIDECGLLHIVDRKKDMIITGGENVYSSEVENVLSMHPAVSEVAVVGVPHDVWGEAVKAFVSRRDGFAITEAELIEFCRGKIAGYKIPKFVAVSDAPLPKTGPGKISKRQLREFA